MLKEIAEQPRASPTRCSAGSARTASSSWTRCGCPMQELREDRQDHHRRLRHRLPRRDDRQIRDRALGAACPCEVELASEFRYRDPILTRTTLVIAISQSGETMDTLMAVRHAREQRSRVLAICNTNGSSIPRESDAVLYTHAGPEIAVASTKAFVAQLRRLLPGRRCTSRRCGERVRRRGAPRSSTSCGRCPRRSTRCSRHDGTGPRAGQGLADARCVLFLGRHVGLPGRAGGCAQAQGARVHPRGGLRRRRAQARARSRSSRTGLPVVVIVPRRRGRGVAARQDRLEHPGDPGAGRQGPS